MRTPSLVPGLPFKENATVLPGDARVHTFERQPYNWTSTVSAEIRQLEVAELLARLKDPSGAAINNQRYFNGIHEAGLGPKVDKMLVMAAIDFAIEHDLVGGDKSVAINVFQASATPEFFDEIKLFLNNRGLQPNDIVIELLEHETEITEAQVDAISYGQGHLGFHFALDDVDPRNDHDRKRVAAFGDSCDFLKLRREVARDCKNGIYPEDQYEADIAKITESLSLCIVAEGVPRQHQYRMSARIGATQSMFGDLAPLAY